MFRPAGGDRCDPDGRPLLLHPGCQSAVVRGSHGALSLQELQDGLNIRRHLGLQPAMPHVCPLSSAACLSATRLRTFYDSTRSSSFLWDLGRSCLRAKKSMRYDSWIPKTPHCILFTSITSINIVRNKTWNANNSVTHHYLFNKR